MSADQSASASASASPIHSVLNMSEADYKKLVTDTKAMENEFAQGWRELTQTPQLVRKLQQEYRLSKAKHQRTLKRLRFESALGVKEFPFSSRGTNPKLKRTHCVRRTLGGNELFPHSCTGDEILFHVYKMGTSGKITMWGPILALYDPDLDGVIIGNGLFDTTLQRNSETGEVEVTKVEKQDA